MLRSLTTLLLLIACSFHLAAQDVRKYSASVGENCSETIWLFDANHRFVFERNCDGASKVCFGVWGLKKDTLLLNSYVESVPEIIDTVMSTGDDKDRITLKVLDRNGIDISDKIWACIRPEGRAGVFFTSGPDGANAIMRLEGTIALFTLEKLFNKTIAFPVTEASDYIVKLALDKAYIPDAQSDWGDIGMARLVKINDQWMSITQGKMLARYFIETAE